MRHPVRLFRPIQFCCNWSGLPRHCRFGLHNWVMSGAILCLGAMPTTAMQKRQKLCNGRTRLSGNAAMHWMNGPGSRPLAVASKPDAVFAGAAIVGIPTLRELGMAGSERAKERMAAIASLVLQTGAFATKDYDFLYDKKRHLFRIGYNVG